PEAAPAKAAQASVAEPTARPRRRGRPHGRRPLPENLPRRVVEHELTEAERLCGCGQVRVPIGVQTSEPPGWQPASLFGWERRGHKYACPVGAARSASALAAEPSLPLSGAVDSMTEANDAAPTDSTGPTRPAALETGADSSSINPVSAETRAGDCTK